METQMEFKKNAVDLTDLALGILILGITVTVGANILIGMRDSRLTDLPTLSTYNETITGSNTTASSLTNPWFESVSAVYNATDGAVVGSGNYTVSADAVSGQGQFLVVGSEFNGASLNVSYDYYDTSQADWALANDAASGLAEYGNWFDIIVIVGVAAVILTLIFMAFGRREESGNVAY